MASVHSPFRTVLKPLIYKLIGPKGYQWFFLRGKIRDIKKKLVEEPEMTLLPRIIGREDVVLDIGANFAYYTVRMAKLCPQGEVIAFEPIPATFEVCQKIVRHFGLKNVTLHKKGVGFKAETLQFEVPLQKLGVHSAGQAHLSGRNNGLEGREKYYSFSGSEKFDCQVVSLDGYLSSLEKLSFIKMDIEGAEYFALQGMVKTLARFKPVILMEVCPFFLKGFGLDTAQIDDFMSAAGYSAFRYLPDQKKLSRVHSDYSDGNYLFIHRDRVHGFSELMLEGGGLHGNAAAAAR